MPDVIIVAGPNGAGKTTFCTRLQRELVKPFAYVNIDEIERSLPDQMRSKTFRELTAARQALCIVSERVQARDCLMIETTLAARTYATMVPGWQQLGYTVSLVFVRLPSADHAIERVKRRVALGGHAIPEETVRRRYDLGLEYLETLYKPVVDQWYVWDSIEGEFLPAEAWDRP